MQTIFIGGSGRCGTKLLRDILGAHSKITALPYATRFTIDPDGLVDTYKALTTGAWSPYIAGVKIRRLTKLLTDIAKLLIKDIPGYLPMVDALIDRLASFKTLAHWSGGYWGWLADRQADIKAIMADFMQAVTTAILEKHGGEIYVDHNTWNPLFTPELLELCPDSIHIHIYRDPRDVVDSMTEQRWCPDDKMQCAQMYDAVMEQITGQPHGAHALYMRFEALVALPVREVIWLCGELDIDYEPAMLEPVDKEAANIGRYKADSIFETTAMMEILQPHMERYGYE